MMSNDDSFSNIAPGVDEDLSSAEKKDRKKTSIKDKAEEMNIDDLNINSSSLKKEETKADKEKSQSKKEGKSKSKVYDIDETINSIIV